MGTQAYGLDVWYAGSLLAPISLGSVEFWGGSPGSSCKSNPDVFAWLIGLGNLLDSEYVRRPRGLIHTSGMKTVNIMYESLRKAYVTRPSDA